MSDITFERSGHFSLSRLLRGSRRDDVPSGEKRKVKFNPYRHPTPGEVTVKIKEPRTGELKDFTLKYDPKSIPDPKVTPREEIKLEGIEKELVEQAKEVALSLAESSNTDSISFNKFIHIYSRKIDELIAAGKLPAGLKEVKGFNTLVTYLSVKTLINNKGFLKRIPNGFFDFQGEEFIDRLQVVSRYFLMNLVGLNTARKVEEFTNWTGELAKAGLRSVSNMLTADNLLDVSFPGYLCGGNPPIRRHLIPGAKWKGDREEVLDLVTCCAKGVVEQYITPDANGFVSEEELLAVDWQRVINDYDNGLITIIQRCPYVNSYLDVLELAIPGFFEIYPRHRLEYKNKWSDENRLDTLDAITRYIVEDKLKLVDEKGKVSASKIKAVRNWFDQYETECGGCIKSSGIGNANNALERVYPHLFGWGDDQVNPGDVSYDGMWEGIEGRRLFKLKFAKSIQVIFDKLKQNHIEGFNHHEVSFDKNSETPLMITRKDFISLKNAYLNNGITWDRHFKVFKLAGGCRAVCSSVDEAFEILFGELNRDKEFGDSGICKDDITGFASQRQLIIQDLTRNYDVGESSQSPKIKNLSQMGYVKDKTGLEDTFLYYLYKDSLSVEEKRKGEILYEAFSAAVSPTKREDTLAVERMFFGKVKKGERKGEYILKAENIKPFLRIIKDDVLPNLTMDEQEKEKTNKLLEKMFEVKTPIKEFRNIFQMAITIDKSVALTKGDDHEIDHPTANNDSLHVLNDIFEHLFEALVIHEIKYERITGHYSRFYHGAFDEAGIEGMA